MAHAGTARRTRVGTSRKPASSPARELEQPEEAGQNRPPRKNPEKRQSVGHSSNPALEPTNSNPPTFLLGGAVVAKWTYYRGHKLGPYYNFRYREQGRVRHVYLGREGPQVQAVRDCVAKLRQSVARLRLYERKLERANRQLRALWAEATRQPAEIGLSLKGFEIRGRRNSGLDRRV
jgi:hypothetical protein